MQGNALPPVRERNSILILCSLSVLAGVLCAPWLKFSPWLYLLFAIAVGIVLCCRFLGRKRGLALIVAFFAVGVLRTQGAMRLPVPETIGSCSVQGYVCGEVTDRGDGRYTMVLSGITLDGKEAPGKAYCTFKYGKDMPELFDGALLSFKGYTYLPGEKTGDVHFDFRIWMLQKGLNFGISSYELPQVLNTQETAPITDAAYRVRNTLCERLTGVLGDNARVAMALLFGERDGLTEDENKAFSTLGIAHVMSVSGLHVGIIGMLLIKLLDALHASKKLQLPIVAVFLLAYCWLTGFSASSMRAAIMLVLGLGASMAHRRSDRLTTLAVAMLIILLVQPLQAFSAGFVLSFCAMLGITVLTSPVQNAIRRILPYREYRKPIDAAAQRYNRVTDLIEKCTELVGVSIAAQAGVLLPTMVFFHQLPTYGILMNILLVPFIGGILVPALAIVLPFSFIPGVGILLGMAAGWLVKLLLMAVKALAELPGAVIRVPQPSLAFCLCIAFAVLCLTHQLPGKKKQRILAAALSLLIAVGCAVFSRPAELRYIQLACGQEDSALLMDGRTTILIDTGEDASEAIDYLQAECRDVDVLYLTHLHADHASGMQSLLDAGIPIHQVYIPLNGEKQQGIGENVLGQLNTLRSMGVPVSEIASGSEHQYNHASISVLWPPEGKTRTGMDPNDMSMALLINLDGYTLYAAGDISSHYDHYAGAPADILKVAHHGSSANSSEAFLQAVQPTYAIITCKSTDDSHPSADVLNRLEAVCPHIFRTDETGDILIAVENGKLQVSPYRGGAIQ